MYICKLCGEVYADERAHNNHQVQKHEQNIGKLDKNRIEDKIKGYYVHGKISEDHRQFLKDNISEYYEKEESSE